MNRMYDKKEIDKAIRKYKKKYPEAEMSIGMRNDWFWTAEGIENKDDWDIIGNKFYRIAGIPGSNSDTPTLSIDTGEEEILIEVYTEIASDEARPYWEENSKLLEEEGNNIMKEE